MLYLYRYIHSILMDDDDVIPEFHPELIRQNGQYL
jgi:hypothetical protein